MEGLASLLEVTNTVDNTQTWMIVIGVLSLMLGILIPALFLTKENKKKYKEGFLGNLYSFLSFDKVYIKKLIQFLYITITLYLVLSSFMYIKLPLVFFKKLFVGVFIPRAIAELATIIVKIDNK